jgi:Transposase IS116/IS110/IS902 family/Calcineurin-like phosphoesterase
LYDRSTGRVVGLLTLAPFAAPGRRDSYAIPADRLRLAWPGVLEPRPGRPTGWVARGVSELVVLHLSDPQFGRGSSFGGNDLIAAAQANDVLFRRLHNDLDRLAENDGLRPDLMVITGDLADCGRPSEFEQVAQFLIALTEALELPRRHVAIVPGNHDVNRNACEAYFLRQKADEREPVAPYWPKWEHFAAVFEQYYERVAGVSFTPDEPRTLFEMPDLAVVVAGLNSTMAESHRDADHYGLVGQHQLRWFADRCTLHLEHIDHLTDMITRLDTRIDEASLPFAQQATLLATIPGIGERAAQVIISEIGVDMTRFPTAAHLASWAGLCPGNNESAGQHRSGKTRKGSKQLCATLTECAWAAGRTSTYVGAQFRRFHRRFGKSGGRKAAIATAHTLIVIIWHVLTQTTAYRDLGSDYFTRRIDNPEARKRRLIRELETLGHKVTIEPATA